MSFSEGDSSMKKLTGSVLLTLLLMAGSVVRAQTFEESYAAYEIKDYATAFAGFMKLAKKGDAYAQYFLGDMYDKGLGVSRNKQQAEIWNRNAAEQGNAYAQFYLGFMYHGLPKGDEQAVAWYRKAAEQGHDGGQFLLGLMYSTGQGVPKDEQLAATWYEKAAVQGNANAQYLLAGMYAAGSQGGPKDEQRAAVWYGKAAEQGNVIAQYLLGVMYLQGKGVPKDEQTGVNWVRKAAERGNADAQYSLGAVYITGLGVPKDKNQAVAWYRKAAEQGNAHAQLNLGAMYVTGQGVPKDEQEGVNWVRKAAERGNADAQHAVGLSYAAGQGVPRDYQLAYFWLLLASASGAQDAAKDRDIAERKLSPDQRGAAQTDARNWKAKTASESNKAAVEGSDLESTPGRQAPASSRADSTGSGFRVAPGTIVTNHHVVEGCRRLRVNGVAAQLRGSDARSDLALVNVTLAGTSTRLRAQRAAVGEPVAVAGYPLRGLLSGFNMTTGTLSSLSGAGGDTRLLQITAPVQPGNSGGPALDSAGNLLGVVVSKLDAIKTAKITGDIPQNVNFAINTNVLRAFLDANSVDYETASSAKPLLSTAIAEKANGFTVLVECWK
jgi:TPR repeat protein